MAMFKMNPMMAGDSQLCVVAGSYVFTNAAAAAPNTVVQAALFKASANAQGSAIGQNETVAPQGSKVPCVINPQAGYAAAVATGGNPTICLIDLRAYPGDLCNVQVGAIPAVSATAGALNPTPLDASVIGIDQGNNFVYVMLTSASGTPINAAAGVALHFVAYFKDGFAP